MSEIDSLEISIKSSVDEASKSIDTLVGKLGNILKGINQIGNSNGMDAFAKQSSSITASMEKVSDSINGASRKVQTAVKNINDSSKKLSANDFAKNLSETLINNFNISNEHIRSKISELSKIIEDGISTDRLGELKIDRSVYDAQEELANTVIESGKVIRQELKEDRQELRDFYEDFKRIEKIKVPAGFAKGADMQDIMRLYPGKFSTKEGLDLTDVKFSEMASGKSLFSEQDLQSQENMLSRIIELVRQYRTEVEYAVNVSSNADLRDSVWEQIIDSTQEAIESLKKPFNEMEEFIKGLNERFADFTPELDMNNISGEIKKYENQLRNSQNALNEILSSSSADKQSKGIERLVIKINEAQNALKKLNEVGRTESLNVDVDPNIHLMSDEVKRSLDDIVDELDGYMLALRKSGDYKPFAEAQRSLEELIQKFPEATSEIKFFESELKELDARGFSNQWNGVEVPENLKQSESVLDGFKKEIGSAGEKISEFEKTLANLHPIEFSGNFYEMEKWVNDLQASLEKLYTKQERLNGLGVKPDSRGMKGISYDIAQISKTLDVYEKKLEEARAAGKLEIQIPPIDAPVDQIISKTKILKDNLADMKINLSSDSLQEVEKQIEKVKQAYLNLVEKMGKAAAVTPFYGASSDFKKKQIELSALRQRYQDLINKQKELAISGEDAAKQFRGKLDALVVPDIKITDPKKLQNHLAKLEADLDKFKAKLQNDITMGRIVVDDKGYRKAIEQITLTEKSIEATKKKISEVGAAGDTQNLSRSMAKTANVGKQLEKVFANLSKKINHTFRNITKLASEGFKNLSKGISNAVGNAKKLIGSFEKFISTNKKTNISFSDGLKKILKYVFGIRSLFVLFNMIRRGFGEGINNLVQYSDRVNHSVSLMTSALGALKNSFATAFAPILNVVAPYITKFINMMTDAFNAVGRFFAALTGKKITVQASKYYKDYAAGLGGVADAAKEARKALHTLGIDELNIINEDKDKGGAGDVSIDDMFTNVPIEGAIADWAKRIRDAFLAGEWEELGKTIAELVNAGLQKVYDAITDITPKVEQALKNFAKVFNSFVEYLDWDLLGRTIGAGVNLITKSVNALLGDEGIDFENLGRKLSVGFRGMVDEIDWRELGNALGNGFMVAWRIADGFIEDMWRINPETLLNGCQELGIAIGEAVNGIFDRINFEQIARVITEGFRGILEAVASALNEIHFDDIAANINKGLEVLYNNTKWEHIGEQVTKFAEAVVKAFNDLLAIDYGLIGGIIGNGITIIVRAFNTLAGEGGINFEQLGANISNGLRNLFSNIPWEEFGNALGNGFMIGWRILDGFVTSMSQQDGAGLTGWAQLGIAIGNAINGIFQKIDFETIANVLVAGFNGVIEMLKNFIVTIEWGNIAINLTNGLNNMIHGINWAEAGATLSDFVMKLLGVFQEVAKNTDWQALGRGIGTFLSNIDWKGILGAVIDGIKNTLGGLIDGLKETSVGKIGLAVSGGILAFKGFEKIGPVAEEIFGAIFGPKGKIIAELLPGIAGIVTAMGIGGEDLSGAIIDLLGGLLDSAIEALNNMDWGAFAQNIIDFMFDPRWYSLTGKVLELAWALVKGLAKGLWDAITSITWGDIWNWILECFKNLFGIHSPSTVMQEQGGFLMQGLINGINAFVENIAMIWANIKQTAVDAWSGIKDTISGIWDEVWEKASEVWNSVTGYLSEVWENIRQSASEKFEAIKEKVSNAWDGAREKAHEIWDNVSSYLSEKWEGIKNTATEKFFVIKEKISEAWDNVKEKATSVWNEVTSYLSEKWESIKVSASEKFAVVKEKVLDAWSGISEKTSETWGTIKESLGNTWENLRNSAQDKFEEIKTKISDAWNKTKENTISTWDEVKKSLGDKIPGIVEDVKGFFSNLPNDMLENGKNILNGLINGINEKTAPLREKVKEVAGNVSAWFKEKLDIHSPSGVFEDIAKFTLQGFINEADRQKAAVKNTMLQVAQNAISAFDGTDKEFNSIGTNMISSMDKAVFAQRNVMANQMKGMAAVMKDSFNGLDNAFSQIGSNVMNSFMNAISGFGNSIRNIASNIGSTFSNALSGAINFVMPSFGGQSYSYSVPTYATGGFPDFSSPFVVGENGAEIMGGMYGKPAIANGDSITDGIRQASYEGMKQALSEMFPYLADIAENTRRTADKDMSVRIGDRDIYDANKRATSRLGWEFT